MTTTQLDVKHIGEQVQSASTPFRDLLQEMHRVIVGQDDLLHGMMIGLLANGHLLIEGVPGLAKTTAVSCLAAGIHTGFQRIPNYAVSCGTMSASSAPTSDSNAHCTELDCW